MLIRNPRNSVVGLVVQDVICSVRLSKPGLSAIQKFLKRIRKQVNAGSAGGETPREDVERDDEDEDSDDLEASTTPDVESEVRLLDELLDTDFIMANFYADGAILLSTEKDDNDSEDGDRDVLIAAASAAELMPFLRRELEKGRDKLNAIIEAASAASRRIA